MPQRKQKIKHLMVAGFGIGGMDPLGSAVTVLACKCVLKEG
jgi:hypothetical protein